MKRDPGELRPLMTRLPERLRAHLAKEARRNGRSLNAEINHRLEMSGPTPAMLHVHLPPLPDIVLPLPPDDLMSKDFAEFLRSKRKADCK